MKYVIFQTGETVLFAESVTHAFVAGSRPVRSAGFCVLETNRNRFDEIRAKAICYGGSDSLGVTSRPEDAEYISAMWI